MAVAMSLESFVARDAYFVGAVQMALEEAAAGLSGAGVDGPAGRECRRGGERCDGERKGRRLFCECPARACLHDGHIYRSGKILLKLATLSI